ncbi:MAG: phosphoenolpyruvate carboxylase, partial [Lysobacteraceae bacterium]
MNQSPAPVDSDADAPLRAIEFVATDALLRDDVRRLGAMIGQMLAEQASPAFLAQVESLRRTAIARRENAQPVDALADILESVPLQDADALVRAFAAYFGATNLAERVHRIRRRRDYQQAGSAPQPGGLEAVLTELRDSGVSFDAFAAMLARLRIEPVFTAHPTEAVRRTLLEKEREIVERLVDDIDRTHTPPERRADLERIRFALTAAWQTSEVPPTRPTVTDEREHVGFYLADVLYRVLPVFHEVFAAAIEKVFSEPLPLPSLLRFGTWVGGDMDGNPNVGAATILAALEAQREQVLANYRRDLHQLSRELTQTRDRIGVDPVIDARIAELRALLPDAPPVSPRHSDMPYRELLELMAVRLRASTRDEPGAYIAADELLADLELIDASLGRHRGDHAGRFAVRRVIRRVQAFGFHLAALDLRQDSAWHDAALAALFNDAQWASHTVDERV